MVPRGRPSLRIARNPFPYNKPLPPVPKWRRRRRYGMMARNKRLYRSKPGGDMLQYPGIGIPTEFRTKLNYVQDLTMTAGIGSSYKIQQFLGNSLYDPDYTGIGLQPEYLIKYVVPMHSINAT